MLAQLSLLSQLQWLRFKEMDVSMSLIEILVSLEEVFGTQSHTLIMEVGEMHIVLLN
jgi:hypothetical protein